MPGPTLAAWPKHTQGRLNYREHMIVPVAQCEEVPLIDAPAGLIMLPTGGLGWNTGVRGEGNVARVVYTEKGVIHGAGPEMVRPVVLINVDETKLEELHNVRDFVEAIEQKSLERTADPTGMAMVCALAGRALERLQEAEQGEE